MSQFKDFWINKGSNQQMADYAAEAFGRGSTLSEVVQELMAKFSVSREKALGIVNAIYTR